MLAGIRSSQRGHSPKPAASAQAAAVGSPASIRTIRCRSACAAQRPGNNGGVMRVRSVVAVLLLSATGSALGAISAGSATAASCSAITISQGRNLSFDVSSVIVASGGCVRFANLTDVTVTVSVSGSSFSEKLPARTPASASAGYTATKSATVTATDGVRTGHGSITVEKSGATTAATPTPTRSAAVVPPVRSSTPTPAATTPKASHGADVPSDVSTDEAAAVNTQHPFAPPALPVLPALPPPPPASESSAAPPTASHPVVAPQVKRHDPRFTSTVLDPVSGPRRGLPATVAVVLLIGLLAAYGRTVLVAGDAVDSRSARRPVRRTV